MQTRNTSPSSSVPRARDTFGDARPSLVKETRTNCAANPQTRVAPRGRPRTRGQVPLLEEIIRAAGAL
eukprot:297236-Lingulodinium_polyedra.AAC.1